MTSVKQRARKAEDSQPAEWGARAGLVARGLLWLVVGLLAVQVALGDNAKADKGGALRAMKDQPLGTVLLIALALAFAAHAAYRVLEGTVGRRDEEHVVLKRAWSWCRVLVYGFFAGSTVKFLLSGKDDGNAKGPTARVLDLPAGRVLVLAVGVGVVVGGVVQAWRGLSGGVTDDLKGEPSWVPKVAGAGLLGRGAVYVLVGSFLVHAGWTADPGKAKGLDEALKTLTQQAFGPFLLLVTAAGLLAFAAWSFLEARYRDL